MPTPLHAVWSSIGQSNRVSSICMNGAGFPSCSRKSVSIRPTFRLSVNRPIPTARGVIFGLDLSHSRAHIFRAVLEAVMYGFRHHVDVLASAGLQPTRLMA